MLLAAAFAPRHGLAVSAACAASYGLFGCTTAGYSSAYLEVAPQCTGQCFALGNAIATLPGILVPLIVEALRAHLGNLAGFRVAFALFGFGAGLPALLVLMCCFRAEPAHLRRGGVAPSTRAAADTAGCDDAGQVRPLSAPPGES